MTAPLDVPMYPIRSGSSRASIVAGRLALLEEPGQNEAHVGGLAIDVDRDERIQRRQPGGIRARELHGHGEITPAGELLGVRPRHRSLRRATPGPHDDHRERLARRGKSNRYLQGPLGRGGARSGATGVDERVRLDGRLQGWFGHTADGFGPTEQQRDDERQARHRVVARSHHRPSVPERIRVNGR